MKVILLVENDRRQVVLTPETNSEKAILEMFHEGKFKIWPYKGSFYSCRGGWTRESELVGDNSTILVLAKDETR